MPVAGQRIPQVTEVAAGEVEEKAAGGSALDAGKALVDLAATDRESASEPGPDDTASDSADAMGTSRTGSPEVPYSGTGSGDAEGSGQREAMPAAAPTVPQGTNVAAGEVEERTAGGSPLDAGKTIADEAASNRRNEPQQSDRHSGSGDQDRAEASGAALVASAEQRAPTSHAAAGAFGRAATPAPRLSARRAWQVQCQPMTWYSSPCQLAAAAFILDLCFYTCSGKHF